MKKFIFNVFILIFGQVFGQNLPTARKGSILDALAHCFALSKVQKEIEAQEVVVLSTVEELRDRSRVKTLPTLLQLAAIKVAESENLTEKIVDMSHDLQPIVLSDWIERNYSILYKIAFMGGLKAKSLTPAGQRLIVSIGVLPDGRINTGYRNGTVKIWDSKTGQCLHTLNNRGEEIYKIEVLPDGNIVTGYWHGAARIWDSKTRQCLHTFLGYIGSSPSIEVLPDGSIIIGYWDGVVKIWDSKTGKCLHTLTGLSSAIALIKVLPDGRIITVYRNGVVKIWDSKTGQCLHTLIGLSITGVGVLSDGRIITGSWDGAVKIWDSKTCKCLYTLSEGGKVIDKIEVLPDGRIITGSWDGVVKIWDSKTWQCLHTLTGHHGKDIDKISILPNGIIVTVYIHRTAEEAIYRTAKIWDSKTGECLRDLIPRKRPINQIRFLPNGNIVILRWGQNPKIWNIEEAINDLISDNGNITLESLIRVKRLIEESKTDSSAVAVSAVNLSLFQRLIKYIVSRF